MQPLVSVICLSYNHEQFLREAVESVIHQSYSNIQIILVDDASTDGSVDIIKKLKQEYPSLEIVLHDTNLGNCKAFNTGLTLAKGEYCIDLAADDVLMPDRVEKGVGEMQNSGDQYGIHFSDAEWIDETGKHIRYHSEQFPNSSIPQGDIYRELISRYFICPPTVMFTRSVADHLGGYDETLSYEDFDFWIRSSRKFYYCYSPQVLVKKRVTWQSLSKQQDRLFSRHSASTYRVCEKIRMLNRTKEEQVALSKRIWYEIVLNLRLLNFRSVACYFLLWIKNRRIRYSE